MFEKVMLKPDEQHYFFTLERDNVQCLIGEQDLSFANDLKILSLSIEYSKTRGWYFSQGSQGNDRSEAFPREELEQALAFHSDPFTTIIAADELQYKIEAVAKAFKDAFPRPQLTKEQRSRCLGWLYTQGGVINLGKPQLRLKRLPGGAVVVEPDTEGEGHGNA